jgi:hypothetical protein
MTWPLFISILLAPFVLTIALAWSCWLIPANELVEADEVERGNED